MLSSRLWWAAMAAVCAGPAIGAAEDGAMGGDLRYGFRYDPMDFVEESETLQAALVRRFVFDTATAQDEALLQAEIDRILADQREDGSFGDTSGQTGEQINELHRFGYDMKAPEAQRAADVVLAQHRAGKWDEEWYTAEGCINGRALHALIRTGRHDAPETLRSLNWLAEHPDKMIGKHIGCPWTQEIIVNCVWDGRELAPMGDFIDRTFVWMRDSMSAAGQITYKDPWSFVFAAAYTGHPVGEEVVRKQLPMVLRGQRPDGGWHWESQAVFLALKRYGLFETLHALPPLPPDWDQVQVLSLPPGDYRGLTWDGMHFWTLNLDGSARCVSVDGDGVGAELAAPDGARGLAAWDGGLAITVAGEPPRLSLLDAATGDERRSVELQKLKWVGAAERVGDKLWVGDDWFGRAIEVDLDAPGATRLRGIAGPHPGGLAATPEGIWHIDRMAQLLIQSEVGSGLLQFADLPFGDDTTGTAWDGERLWVVDNTGDRLVAIEPRVAPTGSGSPG